MAATFCDAHFPVSQFFGDVLSQMGCAQDGGGGGRRDRVPGSGHQGDRARVVRVCKAGLGCEDQEGRRPAVLQVSVPRLRPA
jgi:hypothetical protein